MSTLNLGVVDIPYPAEKIKEQKTTFEVAEYLEDEYHLMEIFFIHYRNQISELIADSMAEALNAFIVGREINPYLKAESEIRKMFHDFLSSGEAERVGIPGTPTAAALKGVNHRKKHPYAKKNKRRPSFVDTRSYMNSFRAWVDSE